MDIERRSPRELTGPLILVLGSKIGFLLQAGGRQVSKVD
jgi:hypothetical protein